MEIKNDIQQNNSLLTKSLVASDNDYTKKDAILHQWNLEGRFNIYDVMNGNATVKLQDPILYFDILLVIFLIVLFVVRRLLYF